MMRDPAHKYMSDLITHASKAMSCITPIAEETMFWCRVDTTLAADHEQIEEMGMEMEARCILKYCHCIAHGQ